MKLSQKLDLIMQKTGWDCSTTIRKVVQAIPKKYADPDGGIPLRYTIHGADAILFNLTKENKDETT